MEYIDRIVDDEIRLVLRSAGAVVIEGPRACGKTVTSRQHAGSAVFLDADAQAELLMQVDPRLVLEGKSPRLLDEWQSFPALWNYVRREVDERGTPGQFILTGSATPADDQTRHSGAGRFGHIRMRPMTLFELGRGTGTVSLKRLFAGGESRSRDPGLTIPDLIGEVVRGGWPGTRKMTVEEATRSHRDYLNRIRRTDVNVVDGVKRDPDRLAAVMQSLARNTATQAALSTVAADASGSGAPIADDTVRAYLGALSRLFVIEDQPAWNTHLRSSHRLRRAPTRHFVDPSLAASLLRATPASLFADLKTFGLLFESLVIRDLRVYAQALAGEVFHYRDQSGLEVDAVIDAGDRWAGLEIKLGVGQIDSAAYSLRKFRERVDTSRRGEPAFLAVVVGSGLGYRRSDGVHVIPVGALGP